MSETICVEQLVLPSHAAKRARPCIRCAHALARVAISGKLNAGTDLERKALG